MITTVPKTSSFRATKPIGEAVTTTPEYSHGYTEEQVLDITAKFKAIQKRDLLITPVTLAEMQEVIVPNARINRTTEFTLQAKAVKAKAASTVRSKAPPKPKKLTKKAIAERLSDIVFKRAAGTATAEEEAFFNEQVTKAGALT